jgi:hypothetical protein
MMIVTRRVVVVFRFRRVDEDFRDVMGKVRKP